MNAAKHHVVVDGSNLATEGRTLPSLAQLDEAVRAYADEDSSAEIVVVVDATFDHRIDESERAELEQAKLHGEVVSPPAGAIGRGDAFVLRIADKTGATVLSNDSFQEFHSEYPWLFDEGRLVGGKPVPGVGWIFTPRTPVRGPKSRDATARAKTASDAKSAGKRVPAAGMAADVAKAARKVLSAARTAGISDPKIGDVLDAAVVVGPGPGPTVEERDVPVNKAAGEKKAAGKKEAAGKKAVAKKAPAKKAASKKAPVKASAKKKGSASGADAPGAEAVNDSLSFITFVATYPIGSTIEGKVSSFTSHGAMVEVALPDKTPVSCYIPLKAMSDPPPIKAREVLRRGESRQFVVEGLDPARRVVELGLGS